MEGCRETGGEATPVQSSAVVGCGKGLRQCTVRLEKKSGSFDFEVDLARSLPKGFRGHYFDTRES